jgi:hypothetical protein
VFDVHAAFRQSDGGVKKVVRAAEGTPTTPKLVTVLSSLARLAEESRLERTSKKDWRSLVARANSDKRVLDIGTEVV